MSRLRFVEDHANTYRVKRLCELVEVSWSGSTRGGPGRRVDVTSRTGNSSPRSARLMNGPARPTGHPGSRVSSDERDVITAASGSRASCEQKAWSGRTHAVCGGEGDPTLRPRPICSSATSLPNG